MADESLCGLEELIADYCFLIQESFLGHAASGNNVPSEVAQAMESEVLPRLRKLLVRAQCIGRRYTVAVVGLSNVGKSTLLNALLGQELAPAINGPCTAAVVEFVYGDEIVLRSRSAGRLPKTVRCKTPEAARLALTDLATGEPQKGRCVPSSITVFAPAQLLRDGLVLVDTPGFGAAMASSASDAHTEVLKRYLADDAAQVFWVVNAKRGITKLDMQFFHQFLADRCDDLVVTRSDYFRKPGSRDEFKSLYSPLFEVAPPLFHFVSGQDAVDGRLEQGVQANKLQQRLEAAGICALEARIRELSDEIGQRKVLENRLCGLASEIGQFLVDFRDDAGRPLRSMWKPSLWENCWASSEHPLRQRLAHFMAATSDPHPNSLHQT